MADVMDDIRAKMASSAEKLSGNHGHILEKMKVGARKLRSTDHILEKMKAGARKMRRTDDG